jgi:hypothetical protein
MSHPVADYLHEPCLISSFSVPKTSGSSALSKLLSAVCDDLKPKITAVIHPTAAQASPMEDFSPLR